MNKTAPILCLLLALCIRLSATEAPAPKTDTLTGLTVSSGDLWYTTTPVVPLDPGMGKNAVDLHNGGTTVTTIGAEPYVTIKPDGTIHRPILANIEQVVEMTQTRLVLEIVYRRDLMLGSTSTDNARWREVWTVKDGKLTFDRIIHPKITPPQPEHIEWPSP